MKRVTEPHANVRVPARVYDVEGGAIFAKNSTFVFFDGFAWTPRLRSPSPVMAPDGGNVPKICGITIENSNGKIESNFLKEFRIARTFLKNCKGFQANLEYLKRVKRVHPE